MAPSIQSKVITVLKRGERVEKVGESGVWTKIELASGEMAWVHRDFVQEVSPQQETPSAPTSPVEEKTSLLSPPVTEAYRETPGETSFRQTTKVGGPVKKDGEGTLKNFLGTKLVTKEVVKMRLKPSLTSKVVLVLKKGRAVEKIGESGVYTKVRLSRGVTGWILTRLLKKVR